MVGRHALLLLVSVLTLHAGDLWSAARGRRAPVAGGGGDHVILVVADGLRWQEVFRGADSLLFFGDGRALGGQAEATRRAYWRASLRDRRAALMPFLWGTVARDGMLLGNRDAGSAVRVTNPMKFSYPGYNEMLVGYPDARIDRNDFGPNPNVTVLEWLHRRRGFAGRVAAAGTWITFSDILNERRSGIPVRTTENDALTHAIALELLSRTRPRALFVGHGETDDFAHKGRYDLTLDAAHRIDRSIAQLWERAQSMPGHRGRTTLIVVADHGRGRTVTDWMHHSAEIPGSDETWIAMIGPGIPSRGESRGGSATLAQVAATVAAAVGLDYRGSVSAAAPALLSHASKR